MRKLVRAPANSSTESAEHGAEEFRGIVVEQRVAICAKDAASAFAAFAHVTVGIEIGSSKFRDGLLDSASLPGAEFHHSVLVDVEEARPRLARPVGALAGQEPSAVILLEIRKRATILVVAFPRALEGAPRHERLSMVVVDDVDGNSERVALERGQELVEAIHRFSAQDRREMHLEAGVLRQPFEFRLERTECLLDVLIGIDANGVDGHLKVRESRVTETLDQVSIEQEAVRRQRYLCSPLRVAHDIVDPRMQEGLAAQQGDVLAAQRVDGVEPLAENLERYLRGVLIVFRAVSAAEIATPRDYELGLDGSFANE